MKTTPFPEKPQKILELQITKNKLVPGNYIANVHMAIDFCNSITDLTIANPEEYEKACEFSKRIQSYLNELENNKKECSQPHKALIKDINTYYKFPMIALENIRKHLRDARGNYIAEQDREEEKRKRAAQKKVVEEKTKLYKEAETKLDTGKTDEAEVLIKQAETTTPALVVSTKPKVEGTSYMDKYTGIVEDKHTFIEWVTVGDPLEELLRRLEFVDINEGKLNRFIQKAKGTVAIPGIRIQHKKIPRDKL